MWWSSGWFASATSFATVTRTSSPAGISVVCDSWAATALVRTVDATVNATIPRVHLVLRVHLRVGSAKIISLISVAILAPGCRRCSTCHLILSFVVLPKYRACRVLHELGIVERSDAAILVLISR